MHMKQTLRHSGVSTIYYLLVKNQQANVNPCSFPRWPLKSYALQIWNGRTDLLVYILLSIYKAIVINFRGILKVMNCYTHWLWINFINRPDVISSIQGMNEFLLKFTVQNAWLPYMKIKPQFFWAFKKNQSLFSTSLKVSSKGFFFILSSKCKFQKKT